MCIRPVRLKYIFFLISAWALIFVVPVGFAPAAERFSDAITRICKNKYQAYVACKDSGNTVWVYLPFTPGRGGYAASKEKDNDLYIEYDIASFNPYRVKDPEELKFLTQKILGEIRGLFLTNVYPYKFFVLVVTDIRDSQNKYDQWYMGYSDDIRNHGVGRDFSGEGYARLVWHQEKITKVLDSAGAEIAQSFRDKTGEHINYREVSMREFVEKQIKWRIYKRFTIEYNKTPFDISAGEKQDEVIKIIRAVIKAYDFKEFENFYLRDSSFLDEHDSSSGFPLKELERMRPGAGTRRPAF